MLTMRNFLNIIRESEKTFSPKTMSNFSETDEGQAWIATGASRETSPEIMSAIAFFARNEAEAEALWNGDFGRICHPSDLWERVTGNGARDPERYVWGAEGSNWWKAIETDMTEAKYAAAIAEFEARVADAETAFPENMTGNSRDMNRAAIWADIVGDDD